MVRVAFLRVGCVGSKTRAPHANAVRGRVPISNRTKLASRRKQNVGSPPRPSFDDETQSMPRGQQQKSSTDSDGVFFLGMALLCTILFTREWIGDAVPILVVPIAALAFTPLGGYAVGKLNEQRQPTQRYRPPQQYQQGNDPGGTCREWHDMRDRAEAEANEHSYVSRVARQDSVSGYTEWGDSQRKRASPEIMQDMHGNQGWGEGSTTPLDSSPAAGEPHTSSIESLQQRVNDRYQPKKAHKKSPVQGGPNNTAGLASAFTAPFAQQSEPQTTNASSTGTPGRSVSYKDRATQTEPQSFKAKSSSDPEKRTAGGDWGQSQARESSPRQEAQRDPQTIDAINEIATGIVDVTEAAAAAAKPASDAVQAAARAASTSAASSQPVTAGTAAARAVANSTTGKRATRAAQAAAAAAAAAAASPSAAAASTFTAMSSAAAATAQSAAKAADSAHRHLNEVLSDNISSSVGEQDAAGATARSSASEPLVAARRQKRREAATVAEFTEANPARSSGAAPLSDAQPTVASQERGFAESPGRAPPSQPQSTSSAISLGSDQRGENSTGPQRPSAAEVRAQTAETQSGNCNVDDRQDGGSQGEPEVVEAVEVLLPDDYEYLQRQRQRLQRRKQAPRARQRSSRGAARRRNATNYGSEPHAGQSARWSGTDPRVYSSGVNGPYAGSRPGETRQAGYAEGVGRRTQRGRSSSNTSRVRVGASGGVQSRGAHVVASREASASSRRMTARDLAAAHEHGRVSRFDSWSGGLSATGPVKGLVQWMFGARARARVRDTVGASRRPLLGALMRVFPFLRSWGGFM